MLFLLIYLLQFCLSYLSCGLAIKIIIKHKFKSRFAWYENRPLTSGCLLGNQSAKHNGGICPRVINIINMTDYWAVTEGRVVKIKCHSEQCLCYSLDHLQSFCCCIMHLHAGHFIKRIITCVSLLACQYLLNLSLVCCNLFSRAVIGNHL